MILLTDSFPFGPFETYLKHELEFLPAYFKKILILSRHPSGERPIYPLAANIVAKSFNPRLSFFEKWKSLRFLFSPLFSSELNFVKAALHLPLNIFLLKIILDALQSASKLKKELYTVLEAEGLSGEQVILYSFWSDYRAMAVASAAKEKNHTAVARAHGWDVYFERHEPPYLPFRKFLHDHLSAQFFVSQDGLEYSLKKIPGARREKYRLARLGTEFHGRNPDARPPVFTVVSCSRFIPLKRVHLMGEILKHLEFPVRWIHFGGGPIMEETVKAIRQRLHNHPHIVAEFRGETDNEAIYDFYLKQPVDLFLLTSEYEGLPLVIMEVFSFGIPVMATDVGGIREMVNEKNGFLLPANFDPKEAAQKITGFRNLAESEKKKFRDEAWDTWHQKFSAQKNYRTFAEELIRLSDSTAKH